jgi:hypothetical protein
MLTFDTNTEINPETIIEKNASCKNCETPLQGNYCHQCGQKGKQPRLTLKVLFNIIVDSLLDIDKGFLHTCKEIWLHPKELMNNYLHGKRVIYTNPIKFLLIWLAVSSLVSLYAVDMDKIMAANVENSFKNQKSFSTLFKKSYDVDKKYKEEMFMASSFITHNQQVLYAIIIPFFAFFLYLFFKRQGYFFTEHLVFAAYSYAAYQFLGSFVFLLYLIDNISFWVVGLVGTIVMLVIMSYFSIQFYGQKENKWWVVFKYFIAQVLTFVTYSFLTGIAINLYAFVTIMALPTF